MSACHRSVHVGEGHRASGTRVVTYFICMRAGRVSSGLSQLVGSELCQNAAHEAALSVADGMIRNGDGKSLYKAVLKQLGANSADPSEVITKLLAMLERSMEDRSGVSAYLMARFFARAHRRNERVACHAIELWMSGLATEEAADALTLLAGEPGRAALVRGTA